MSYMNYDTYQQIMAENHLEPSTAVNLFLERAKHYQRIKTKIEEVLKRDKGNEVLMLHVNQMDVKRWESVWYAIDCARIEKAQGFKFLESGGGDKYVSSLMIVHEGNMEDFTEIEKCTVAYFEMLDEMKKKQEVGHYD